MLTASKYVLKPMAKIPDRIARQQFTDIVAHPEFAISIAEVWWNAVRDRCSNRTVGTISYNPTTNHLRMSSKVSEKK